MSTPPPPTIDRPPPSLPTFGLLLLRRWPIVLLAVVVLGAVGAVYGSGRAPTYTAQAQLIVGPSASSPQALTGTADASVTIAGGYARLGATQPIAEQVARTIGVPASRLADVVQVSSVSGNPLVRIQATSGDQREALRITAAYARGLRSAIDSQISPERLGRTQLASYSRAARAVLQQRARLQRLRANGASRTTIERETAQLNTAELEEQTASDIYSQARQAAQSVTGLTPFDDARIVGDDSRDLLLRWGLVGAAAGLALGVLAAAALAWRRRRVLGRSLAPEA